MKIPKYLAAVPFSITALLIAFYPVQAQANTIVFNTLGPGDTYVANSGVAVGNVGGLGTLLEEAAQFTAMASGNLATVDLGLTGTATGAVNVFLYADSAGSPNNAIQTFLGSGTPTAAFGTTNNSLVSFTVAGTVPVVMGTNYWLVLKPANVNVSVEASWMLSLATAGSVKVSFDDSTWLDQPPTLPAFRITAQGAAVPDGSSSTWVLLLLGVGASFGLNLLLHRRSEA
jgi:hypothetical protein